MIDLRLSESELKTYARKYAHLLPELSPQLINRMAYEHQPMPDEKPTKPEWMYTLKQHISDVEALDKAKGLLMGLAVGDAVGTTLEFQARDSSHIYDMVGGGPFNLKAGEWTDDTSMALCLAETYIEKNCCDMDLFRGKLISWYKTGHNSSNGVCFDIGNTTRYALEQVIKHGPDWLGNNSPETAGNAALIRHAPVAIFRRKSFIDGWRDASIQSMSTHCAPESIDCCQYMNVILHYLLNGFGKNEAFSPHKIPFLVRVLIINAGEYKEKQRDQIRSSGYVIDTLEAALWAVWHTDNFKDAVLLAANLADDADSVAATAGQLAGALYGLSGIPKEWVDKIVQKDRILSMAEELFHLAPEETD
ncbi:ADP-ribosylarginine hydrolase Tri1 [Pantoea agglomerans]|uniref:ADP-ribosylarginine hydrolase Tri1 n=1 Tax=Enterobacter agglomerans TaxID=549 RepID=UPI0013BE6BBE|nr:ADP-ribosylarginine hydrolase Tri1 [Pantoea agglomerans]NEG56883.1 ADP-ribosylglycohydrolase family protein [Pantoea agglomerans]NEG98095.1 ADP-ribosylglycohydrolase family protein [Pantoea agglomerans]NEH01627.1 ADP-ribosylglycohydrolase family protein [Pantoea agglomerans]NEH13208.1 ADP-ribosylglycohydrolase family protein [Pantoea agglomerans]